MSEAQIPCKPLDFEAEFLLLLARMDDQIYWEKRADRRETLIRYQTVILTAGYIGLKAKEFLSLTWDDIINKNDKMIFNFVDNSKRKVYFASSFNKYVERNYRMIAPESNDHLILHRKGDHMTKISTDHFNDYFKRQLVKHEIGTDTPSSLILYKTHMLHMWKILGGNMYATSILSKWMYNKSSEYVLSYLGIKSENK